MTRTTMADAFVRHTIFLGGERQCNKRCGEEIGLWALESVQSPSADPQLDVAQSKHVSIRPVGVAKVFPRAEEEEETNDQARRSRSGTRRGFGLRQCPHLCENRQGERLDPCGRCVGFLVGLEE